MTQTILRLALGAAICAALSGCITFRTVDDGIARARIGETVQSGKVAIRPTRVLEDSRCPAGVQCVWAGRVRIAAELDGAPAELTLGAPQATPGGARVTLVEVYPAARKDTTYFPEEYRFGFRVTR